MRLTAQILTEDEQHRIHKMSLRILEEVGIRFHGDRAPKILRENGIKINSEDKIAKIHPEFVEQALKTEPKSFVLGARNPAHNFSCLPLLHVTASTELLPSYWIFKRVKDAMEQAKILRMPYASSSTWIWV
ncbi:MAG: hypothetical protein A2029_09660 [Chloroflexi bacterium RBG_19FT_COMBO_47_9]|nr:MAG: hypothetical protein A2029_09660 [Chloroflexi bacterium RBG_19FT_COMBO_47_9]